MALAGDVRALRDRALTELTAVHDYFTDTKMAWRIVQKVIRAGHKITIRNMTTGTVTQEEQLAAKARLRGRGSGRSHLPAIHFDF
jgi:hypothetical protein